jgi:hypothetical protein
VSGQPQDPFGPPESYSQGPFGGAAQGGGWTAPLGGGAFTPPAASPGPTAAFGFGPDGPAFGDVGGVEVGRPPLIWLLIGVLAATAAIVVALLLGRSAPFAFAAWAAAGPIAVGLLAIHVVQDTQQRARPLYDPPAWFPFLYWGMVVLAGAGIVVSSIMIALWAGRS